MTVFVDFALEGYPNFADTHALQKLSRTLSESIMQSTHCAFLYKEVGGLRNGTLSPEQRKETYIGGQCFRDAPFSSGGDATNNFRSEGSGSYQALPWGFLAAFAPSAKESLETGKIYRVNQDVYGDPENSEIIPTVVHVPAAMVFARIYIAEGFDLVR